MVLFFMNDPCLKSELMVEKIPTAAGKKKSGRVFSVENGCVSEDRWVLGTDEVILMFPSLQKAILSDLSVPMRSRHRGRDTEGDSASLSPIPPLRHSCEGRNLIQRRRY
jgi:hypothetical protein